MTVPPYPGERVAALDVGSNSIRLLIAEWTADRGFVAIDELKQQPRLAHDLAATGALDPERMAAACGALARMREMAIRRGVTRIAAVATSAVREASNGAAFVARVRDELELPLEIIDAEREAHLSWQSVAHHFRLDRTRTVVADIGGGSLELVAAVDGLVERTVSLPLGAVRLTEQHPDGDHDPLAAVRAMRRTARTALRTALPWRDWRQATLIGSGGSFTNLARMVSRRRGEAAGPIHGATLGTGEVEGVLEWLSRRSPAARAATPGLNPARADIILAGLAVIAELLNQVDAREVTVSGFGLRDGLLAEMAGTAHPTATPDDRLQPLREFVDRCRADRRHAEQVRYLALTLWDQLRDELRATPEERHLLEAAALLHDVGHLMSYRKHHRHSYHLILHAEQLGLEARERRLVALAARYHRRARPSKRHPEFAALEPSDQRIVRRVAAVLRVADGLDRGHTALVDHLHLALDHERCVIVVRPRLQGADLALEVWGATAKAALLARVLDRPVEVRPAELP